MSSERRFELPEPWNKRTPRQSGRRRPSFSAYVASSAVFFLAVLSPWLACGIGQPLIVEPVPKPGSFPLVSAGSAPVVYVDEQDWPGVIRAANDLRRDIASVTGTTPKLAHGEAPAGSRVVIIGTIGKSRTVDQLIQEKQINVASITGQWEATLIEVVRQPLPGIESALVIAGSDKRGTIYGIYSLSEQMGVSPWYWWADVPVRHQNALYVNPGRYVQPSPVVKYRGIFLNDEAPALAGWTKEKFGGFNHRFYTNLFELLLRCCSSDSRFRA